MSASLITEVVSDVLQEPVTVRSAAVFVHSKVLTIYLGAAGILTLAPLMDRVQCSSIGEYETNKLCMANGTYTFEDLGDGAGTVKMYHTSYQYMGFVFLALLLLNAAPKVILNVLLTAGDMAADIQAASRSNDHRDRLAKVRIVLDFYRTETRQLRVFVAKVLSAEMMCVISLVMQFSLCNTIEQKGVLWEVAAGWKHLFSQEAPHHKYFPREVRCTLEHFEKDSEHMRVLEVGCFLPVNVLVLTLFEVLVLLYLGVLLVDGATVVWRILLLFPFFRRLGLPLAGMPRWVMSAVCMSRIGYPQYMYISVLKSTMSRNAFKYFMAALAEHCDPDAILSKGICDEDSCF